MAKPIKHDTSSSVTTAAWGAAKGGILGALAAMVGVGLAGGVIGGLIVAGVTAAIAVLSPVTMAAVLPAALIGGGISAIASGIGALVTGSGVAAVATGGGALFGLLKGSDKVSRENAMYQRRVEQRTHRRTTEVNDAGMMGMQQGYQMGFVEGRNAVINELRAAQEQMLMAQAQPQLAAGGHAARIEQQRAAMAASPAQKG